MTVRPFAENRECWSTIATQQDGSSFLKHSPPATSLLPHSNYCHMLHMAHASPMRQAGPNVALKVGTVSS